MSESSKETGKKAFQTGALMRVVLLRAAASFFAFAILLFWPAGTFDYWEAWAFFGTLFTLSLFVIIHLLRHDPELLERRMRIKEREPAQKAIVKAGFLVFVVAILIPGFDRRFGWSEVPAVIVLFADGTIVAGYLLFVFVVRENRYASRVIEVEPGQKLVATGPYAVVRHPMYVATLAIYGATPLALGSLWGLAAIPGVIGILIARILNEEKVLKERLEGYQEYVTRTRYRLIPYVW